MDLLEAKLAVIAAGKRLVETGLIARTWGNVSARVSASAFVITPSGKAYESLTPDDIVEVNIKSLKYEGNVKPSSEKGVHAQAYLLRPEANFVIHTHQHNASVAAVMGGDITGGATKWWADIVGETVPVAAYGLPGTGKLKKGVAAALQKHPRSRAVLMAHHGALCLGRDAEEAFRVADALERVCLAYLKARALEALGTAAETLDGLHDLVARRRALTVSACDSAPALAAWSSFRSGDAFCMTPEGEGGCAIDVALPTGEVFGDRAAPDTLALHRALYRGDKKINAVVHSRRPDIVRASQSGAARLLPYLDDFAQIAGVNLRAVRFDPANPESVQAVRKALKRRSAVILKGNGALCVGSSMDEARAVETVTEKNCAVSLSADLFDRVKHIGRLDAALMRVIYVKKYAKKK